MSSTAILFWKWEDEEDDGEAVGPVWIRRPDGSIQDWDQWARRSVAERYATDHDLKFSPDE